MEYFTMILEYTVFQNIIKEKIGLEVGYAFGENIPHNYLSPAFCLLMSLKNMTRTNALATSQENFHHERIANQILQLIIRIINERSYPKLDSINYEMGTNIEILDMWYLDQLQDKNRIQGR